MAYSEVELHSITDRYVEGVALITEGKGGLGCVLLSTPLSNAAGM